MFRPNCRVILRLIFEHVAGITIKYKLIKYKVVYDCYIYYIILYFSAQGLCSGLYFC